MAWAFWSPLKGNTLFTCKRLRHQRDNKTQKPYDACLHAKQICCSFSQSEGHASDLFELIHFDIWGTYRESSSCGAYYFLTVVDDKSQTVWVYLMRDKGETSKLVQQFVTFVANQFDKSVKIICSDNGTEFTSNSIKQFYAETGIIPNQLCRYPTAKWLGRKKASTYF